jgi:thiol:disulfide interchange protein
LAAAAALVAAGAVMAVGTTVMAEAPNDAKAAAPKVIAAAFHADWCGMCKEMGPDFMAARESLLERDILFVKFDLTNEKTAHQAAMMASALGLKDVFEAQAPKTGAIKVVDAESGEVVATLTAEHDTAAMKQELEKALAG